MAIILNIIFCISIGVYVLNEVKKRIKLNKSLCYQFFLISFTIEHFTITFLFVFLLGEMHSIHDPLDFIDMAQNTSSVVSLFGFGHKFMALLIYPFVKIGINTYGLFFLFSTISFKGFLILFQLIGVDKLIYNKYLLLVFFLPTLHVWTGSLSKEAILLFLMCILLKEVKLKRMNSIGICVFLAIFMLRPHVAVVLLSSLLGLILMDKNIGKNIKWLLVGTGLFFIVFIFPISLYYFFGITNLNFEGLLEYKRQFISTVSSLQGTSSFSLIETNFLTRLFYLLFMPLPFIYNLTNAVQWLAALENCLLLLLFIYMIVYLIKNRRKIIVMSIDMKFSAMVSLGLMTMFASYLYNLGLGNRMRVVFLPYLLYAITLVLDQLNRNSILSSLPNKPVKSKGLNE